MGRNGEPEAVLNLVSRLERQGCIVGAAEALASARLQHLAVRRQHEPTLFICGETGSQSAARARRASRCCARLRSYSRVGPSDTFKGAGIGGSGRIGWNPVRTHQT